MTIHLTPNTITAAIQFIVDDNARRLKKIISDLQDPDKGAYYQKINICRPLLQQAYQTSHNELQGQLLMLVDHHKVVEEIKAAQKACKEQWLLNDFEIITLQRPGTSPPFTQEPE